MNTKQLIDQLTHDLQPAKKVMPLFASACLWVVISCIYAFVALLLMAPLRPGVDLQLAWPSYFGLEMFVGALALFFWAWTAMAESVPGRNSRWIRVVAWVATSLWVAHFVIALGSPYIESAMIGKREHCAWESFIYSLPPTIYLIWLQQRRYPLNPVRAAVYAAIAAAIIPALAMQVACMYDPVHIMQYHLAPIFYLASMVGVATFVIAKSGRLSR